MTPRGGRGSWVGAALGVLALAASVPVVLVIGQSAAGTSGRGTGMRPVAGLTAPGSSEVGYVAAGLTVNLSFAPESATIPDFTFIGGPEARK